MKRQVSTSDFHEAAYYILNGCELTDVSGRRVNGKIICDLTLKGDEISRLRLTYLNGEAEANILNLRRMVGQVQAWANSSRKKFKHLLSDEAVKTGGRP